MNTTVTVPITMKMDHASKVNIEKDSSTAEVLSGMQTVGDSMASSKTTKSMGTAELAFTMALFTLVITKMVNKTDLALFSLQKDRATKDTGKVAMFTGKESTSM